LIVAKLDRIFRSASEALSTVDAWRNAGIKLIVADMGVDPVTESSVSKMFFGMLALVAEFERERTRERIMDGKRAKKATGGHLGGQRPFGYNVIGKGKEARLDPIPVEQAAIRTMREMRQNGKSLRTIAEAMQAQGFQVSYVTVGTILKQQRGAEPSGQ
jgi:DNA invertase Pin-like site-specific DNA recombinase